MATGHVVGLFTGPEPGGAIRRVDELVAVAGRGIEGDRYFAAGEHDPAHEVTVFAAEGLEAARDESGIDILAEDLRRNIMTSGIDVDALIGTTFRVGDVVIEGVRDNPPCAHLQRLAGKQLLRPLARRGGLRGRILRGGTIRTGDPVEPLGAAPDAHVTRSAGSATVPE